MTYRLLSLTLLILTWHFLGSEAAHGADRLRLRWLATKPVIDSIEITGNRHFSTDQIQRTLYSRKRGFWSTLNNDRRSRVQSESLGRDTLQLRYLYQTGGFIAPDIQLEYLPLPIDSGALLRVNIREGKERWLTAVSLRDSVEVSFLSEVKKDISVLGLSRPVDLLALAHTTSRIKTLYANSGYPYARVQYSLDTVASDSTCHVIFSIDPDSLVHFGRVRIEGLNLFPEKAARRELAFDSGGTYSRSQILLSQSQLFQSGYFSSASILDEGPVTNRTNPDMVIRVRERKSRFVTFRSGAGQSTTEDLQWDLSTQFGQRNFLATRRLELGANYSFTFGRQFDLINHLYRVQFREPWFLRLRMPLILTGEYQPPLQSRLQDYDIEVWRASAATERLLTPTISAGTGLEYQSVDISGVPDDQEELKRQDEGLSIRRRLYLTVRRDTRNNLFVPSRGSITDATAEYIGGFLGGDENFYKLQAGWSRYQLVWPGWVMATRLRGGWGEAFAPSTDIPRDQRYYLGGANTLRGYREREVGPELDGVPDGANFFVLGNLEFRWRSVQLFQYTPLLRGLLAEFPLWQSLFIDVGNGFDKPERLVSRRLAVGYGTGLQLLSPAGPIRVDYARTLRTNDFDAGDAWHFTILYAF